VSNLKWVVIKHFNWSLTSVLDTSSEDFGVSQLQEIRKKVKALRSKEWFISNGLQRPGIAAGGIFYNVRPGTAAQLKI